MARSAARLGRRLVLASKVMTLADAANTILQALVTLVSVGLGGWLTIKASRLAQTEQIEAEARRKRGDKYEELVAAIYEFDHWLDKLRNKRAYGESLEESISPLSKVQAIAAVYFPVLREQVRALDTASTNYQLWISRAAQRRVAGNIAEINKGYDDAITPVVAAIRGLLRAVEAAAAADPVTRPPAR